MSKKAQIKMMETVFVVIIFMVIMIGAFFYFIQSKADSFEKEARQQTVKETISRVSVISGLSEKYSMLTTQWRDTRAISEHDCISRSGGMWISTPEVNTRS